MRIAVVGAGAMGAFIVRDLRASEPSIDLLLVDANKDRAADLASSVSGNQVQHAACDARNTEAMANCLRGAQVVVNAAQYDVNLDVMRACLGAGAHYLDLGGMFHMTRRQLELSPEFQKTELTAVLGMGAAPGLSNLLAKHGADLLDEVESVEVSFAAASPDAPETDIFVPPYSIRTIMQEFCEESVQFIDGSLQVQAPLAGRKVISFADPIGPTTCVFTLHSEPATVPTALAEKGVRNVVWRLGLPESLESSIRAFASAGLGASRAIQVGDVSVSPVEVLATSIEQNMAGRNLPKTVYTEHGAIRAEIRGRRADQDVTVILETTLKATGAPPDVAGIMTGTPAAIAAVMLARGRAGKPGAYGPESVIPTGAMIEELAKRGFDTSQREKRELGSRLTVAAQ